MSLPLSLAETQSYNYREASISQINRDDEQLVLNAPVLNKWIVVGKGRGMRVAGLVSIHPKYESPSLIRTSPIQDLFSVSEKIYIRTHNSIYELGAPFCTEKSQAVIRL